MSSIEDSTASPENRTVEEDGGWQATQVVSPATQIIGDQEEYLGRDQRDVGRDLGNGQHELFVACEPAEALQQQFDHLRPEFIVIHDVGTAASRRMIAGLAQACGKSVQRLVIRRQGQGIDLATLEFTEFTCADARILRIYSTEIDADAAVRQDLARLLMAYSRLGVVMVGDLPSHVLGHGLKPIGDAIEAGPWHNRHLLMLPLASAVTLATLAAQIGTRGPVSVRTTPQVSRPNDAWNYIAGTWNRMRAQLAPAGTQMSEIGPVQRPIGPLGAAASAPSAEPAAIPIIAAIRPSPPPAAALPMQPMPEIRSAGAREVSSVATTDERLQSYVERMCSLKGMVCASVFEHNAQRSLVHAGARPGPAMLAIQGSAMLSAIGESARKLGLGASVPEAAITLAGHHIVLRAVPRHAGMVLHAVLDKEVANLTLARLQIQRLDEMFE